MVQLHVHWLPGRVNPNLRAARWAHQHGKPMLACSDAHSLAAIGMNASTVEAEALTPEALFAAFARAHFLSSPFAAISARSDPSRPGKALAN